MELIDDMKASQEAAIVALNEFLQRYKSRETILHCFYEAKDDMIFYHPVIRSLTGRNDATPYLCKNKEGVLKIYSLIKKKDEYKLARTKYFVDRDFDNLNNNVDIYETPFYSIENFYTQPTTFMQVLVEQFEISRDNPDYKTSLKLFFRVREHFHEAILPLNAYLRCYAKILNKIAAPKLNIDEKIDIRDPVSSDLDLDILRVNSLPQNLEAIENLFQTNGLIDRKEFDAEIDNLNNTEKGQTFRGKFELRFFESFLKRFKTAIEPKKGHLLSKRYTCSIQFSYDTLFTQLHPYAVVPDCLKKYVSSNYA